MKTQRQAKILELIQKEEIETQEDLSKRLSECGFVATQATISRDIKELRLIKISSIKGKYKYAVNSFEDDVKVAAKFRNILSETVIKVDLSTSIVVVKTFSGMAQAAAAAIDNMNWLEIVGTIAGDDTIFVAMKTEEDAKHLTERLRKLLCF